MNVAEKLAREIRRVSGIRHHYVAVGDAGKFALTLIDAALEQGCKAAGVDDAITQMVALQELKGFSV